MFNIPHEYHPNLTCPSQQLPADALMYSTALDQAYIMDDTFHDVEQEAADFSIYSVDTGNCSGDITDGGNYEPLHHMTTTFSTLANALDQSFAYTAHVDANQHPPSITSDPTDLSVYSYPLSPSSNHCSDFNSSVIARFDPASLLKVTECPDTQTTVDNVEELSAQQHLKSSLQPPPEFTDLQDGDIPSQEETPDELSQDSQRSLDSSTSDVIETTDHTTTSTTTSGGQIASRSMASKLWTIKGKGRSKNSRASVSHRLHPPRATVQHIRKSVKSQMYRDETVEAFGRFQAALPENLREGNQIQVLERASEYLYKLETSVFEMRHALKEHETLQKQLRSSIAYMHGPDP